MPSESQQHEFSQDDNAEFSRLALKMRGVGFWFEVYGIIMLSLFAFKLWPKAGNIEIAPVDLLTGLVFLVIGHWTRRGGLGFHHVAYSEGSDLTHLMKAVRELTRVCGLIDRIIFVAVVLAIIGCALAGIWILKGGF